MITIHKTGYGVLAFGLLTLLLCPASAASLTLEGQRQEFDLWMGARTDDGERSLSRLTLSSDWDLRWKEDWQIDLGLRLEFADDDTGLGSTRTYASISDPLIDTENARLEIDQASITRQRSDQQIIVGKQVVAWGVLDGLRVTDRFAPVRLRDFVATESRPERLSRWGIRLRQRAVGGWFDLALALDATVNQLPGPGDAFAPVAPRSRGGLPVGAELPPLLVDRRDSIKDATMGLRFSRRIGRADVSALVINGPDTDPLFVPASIAADAGNTMDSLPAIRLDYPRRTLLGATIETAVGSVVWRAELAHIPDQPVNLLTNQLADSDRKARTLAGVGLDWRGSGGLFVNAQVGLDHQHFNGELGVRPDSDWIGTLRLQQSLAQDTVSLRFEWLGSVNRDNGVFRPGVHWSISDNLRLATGLDWFYGDKSDLFGQFKEQNRIWMRVKLAF